jgi:hypothetical protein
MAIALIGSAKRPEGVGHTMVVILVSRRDGREESGGPQSPDQSAVSEISRDIGIIA